MQNLKKLMKLVLLLLILVGVKHYNEMEQDYSSVSHKELLSLKVDHVIDDDFFTPAGPHSYIINSMYIKGRKSGEVTFYINSSGGMVDLALDQVELINRMKKQEGFSIKCYIKEASSAAFTFTMGACDKRIAMKDATFMTHRCYVPTGIFFISKTFSDSTYLSDTEMAEKEVISVNKSKEDWLKISRQKEDKFYSKDELKKYNIVTSFYEDECRP